MADVPKVKFKKKGGKKRNIREMMSENSSSGTQSGSGGAKEAESKSMHTDEELKTILGPDGSVRREAKCKFWYMRKRYGFVTLEDNSEDVYVHKTQIKTFPKSMEEGKKCTLTVKQDAKGKIFGVDVHVEGCELTDANAWKTKKKIEPRYTLPVFEFKYNPESSMDAKGQIGKAVKDFQRNVEAWMSTWQLRGKIHKEARRVTQMLEGQLNRTLNDHDADTEEFGSIVEMMSKAISDQLTKRKEARMLLSSKQARKHDAVSKRQKKAHKDCGGTEDSAPTTKSSNDVALELKGLDTVGPTESLKMIIEKFGPMTTQELSQIYQKITGQGFKTLVGSTMNHVLRENQKIFNRGMDKKWELRNS
mmetsp:Transcript_5430/g.8022  ORF Transcript_5430/g.8022 Transcript_5430/m.8022 type:complete len:362 (+) Transcript_5430:1631-2716(+)